MHKILFVVLVCASNCLYAQNIEAGLTQYFRQYRPEKIHLHCGHSLYTTGETIYYKAYLMQGSEPAKLSKALYIDWYDEQGHLLRQTAAPVIAFAATGSFTIPASYPYATLVAKAYTRWMLNFDTAFIYSKTISVYQRKNIETAVSNQERAEPFTQVKLYPEGGVTVAGLTNRVAFKAVDESALPVAIKGVVRTADGKTIDSVKTVHDGMGTFTLLPTQNTQYVLEWRDEKGRSGATAIPIQKQGGAVLHADLLKQKIVINVERTAAAPNAFKTMHLLVHSGEALYYKVDLNLSSKTRVAASLPTDSITTGVVQLTLFDADWTPVAERVLFVNNKTHSFFPTVRLQPGNINPTEETLEIVVPDTTFATLSVSVADADTAGDEDGTIFSDLLLSGELKGKIHKPAYYVSEEGNALRDARVDSIRAAHLDLVMLTNGFRRFDWEKIKKGLAIPITQPADTAYLQLEGNINFAKPPGKNGQAFMNVFVQTHDSTTRLLTLPISPDGRFSQPNFFYFDTVRLRYSVDARKTKSRYSGVAFSTNLLSGEGRKEFFSKAYSATGIQANKTALKTISTRNKFFDNLPARKDSQNSILMKEVVVTTRQKTRKDVLDAFYSSGLFAGPLNNYALDVENEISAKGALDVFTFIQQKVPGILVVNPGTPNAALVWFSTGTFNSGNAVPQFFLNEAPVPLSTIQSLTLQDIAYIKVFRPPFVGASLNGPNGAIAIYSKRGYAPSNELTDDSGLATFVLQGYTRFREFADDSEAAGAPARNTRRATLYFNPYIFTNKEQQHQTLKFYRTDSTQKLRITLEGMNAEGKLARVAFEN